MGITLQKDKHMNDPLKQAANLLNENAPTGERLAYVNPFEEQMLKDMGGSGKPAAGDVPSYKKGDVSPPPPRDPYTEMMRTLKGQEATAKPLLDLEREFRPQFAELEKRIQLEQLGIDPSKGMLQAFEEDIAPSQIRQRRAAVEGDIAMVRDLGQELVQAQREADPLAESLRQQVMESSGDMLARAREDYMAGGGLTNQEARDLDQQMLGIAQSRGIGGQNISDISRIRAKISGDRAARQQRLANLDASMLSAQRAYGMGAVNPLYALTQRSTRVPGDVSQQFGTSAFSLDSGPAIFNPESPYAQSLYASNQQNIMDARTATAANRANMFSGALGGLGALGGGALTGSMAEGGFFMK